MINLTVLFRRPAHLVYGACSGASVMSDSVNLWTIAHQAPQAIGFSKQEYWSQLPCPSSRDLLDPGVKPVSPLAPALQADSLPLSHRESPSRCLTDRQMRGKYSK